MSDNISKIKERLSIVDVISGYIKVQKAGANFKARCPFHNEKTPSFYISPERQIWHCFGCQKGGDIFGFVKEIEGVEFPEALQVLAQRAGVKLEHYDPAVRDAKVILYDICETSAKFFEKQLHHSPAGKGVLDYLRERGLAEATIKEFRLGFAPEGWRNLSHFLRDCDYKDDDIISSGLALKKEDGSDMYDRFRSRIIFPIADINGQVAGFTGRVFSAEGGRPSDGQESFSTGEIESAKYINSPQTPIYDKSRILYGLNKAKTESRQADRCLLVEGNMDAIMSYQAGVRNVAATSGTALTGSHLQLLQRYTNNLDFCFDTDQAGLVATRRGIGLALSQNFNIKIVHLNDPACKDPADYVKKFACLPDGQGHNKWQELAQSAKPVLEFYFDKLNAELDLATVEGKKNIIVSLGPLIKRLASRVERAHWISRLAIVLKTKEEAVESDVMSAKDDLEIHTGIQKEESRPIPVPEIRSPNEMLFEALLAVLVRKPVLFGPEIKNLKTELLDTDAADIINEMKKCDFSDFKFDKFANSFNGDQKMRLEFAYLKAQEFLKDFTDDDLKAEFHDIISKFERRSVSIRLAGIEMDIKAAEAGKDKDRLAVLLTEFNKLARELNKN